MRKTIACILILFLQNFVQAIDNEIVITSSGSVRGELLKTLFDEKEYYSFKGIPFAEPPLNDLRYKPPIPIKPWNITKDAFEFGNICLQPALDYKSTIGDEDCLYLNIYTPAESKAILPVLFYIHGGGYLWGSGNDSIYGPDFLIEQNVVVVTINYRLGIAGFLSLGTQEISGNAGLKDQVLALKWINENINNFGGDRNKITIFGESAGGASTNFLTISPTTKGLYQRAILMSGSVYNTWATIKSDDQLEYVISTAKQFKIPATDIDDIIRAFQTYDARELVDRTLVPLYSPGQKHKSIDLWWLPIVENKNFTDTFITDEPDTIYSDESTYTKADIMLGITSLEALFFLPLEIENPELLKPFDQHFKLPLPYKDSKLSLESEDYKPVGAEIREFYFGDKLVDGDSLQEYSELLSDVWFNYGVCKTAKKYAKRSKGKTYFYRFSIEAGLNAIKNSFNASQLVGASHCDELCYLFRCRAYPDLYKNIELDSFERTLIQRITKLFTNFAKYGNPTKGEDDIDLKQVTEETINFVDVRNEGLVISENPYKERYHFWDSLYEKYGR